MVQPLDVGKRALTAPRAVAAADWKRLEKTLFRTPHEEVRLRAYGALTAYLQRANNYAVVRQFLGSFRELLAATLPGAELPPLEDSDNVPKRLNAYRLVQEQEVDLAVNSDYAAMCMHGKQVALQFTALGRSVAKCDPHGLQRAVSSFATRWKAYQFHEKRWNDLMSERFWQPMPDGLVLSEREVHQLLLHPETRFSAPQTSWHVLEQDLTNCTW